MEELDEWYWQPGDFIDLEDCYAPGPDFTCIIHRSHCDELWWYRYDAVKVEGTDIDTFRARFRAAKRIAMTAIWKVVEE